MAGPIMRTCSTADICSATFFNCRTLPGHE
jgi:hypothetical protein